MDGSRNETPANRTASEYLAKLRKKGSDENRIRVARQLYDFINSDLRDNSPQYVNEFIATFDAKVDQSAIYELISSSDNDEKKAGILLIVCLVESAGDESKRVPRFAKYLLKALTNSDETGMKLAARAIAYLIQTSKTFAVELVEKSLNQVCEWLEEPERHEARRLAAVLLARQLALYTSTSFFLRASHFFSNIFNVIRDPKVHVRVAAAKALRAALTVTSQREAKQKSEWYRHCYEEAIACAACESLNREDRQHAMLLILNELLRIGNAAAEKARIKSLGRQPIHNVRTVIDSNAVDWLTEEIYSATVDSRTARILIAEEFTKICEVCTRAMSSRPLYCQTVLLEILPRLSSFQKTQDPHSEYYESTWVDPLPMFSYSLSLTAKHPRALLAIGLLVLDRPTELRPKIGQLLVVIQQMLQAAVNKRRPLDENVFTCLTLVVRALDATVETEMRALLPLIFSTGLSKGLIDVTYETMQCIPGLKTDVQDGLLKELCQVLMNRKLPSKLDPPSAPPIPPCAVSVTNVALTKLALAALGKFDFQRHALQMFIKYIAHGYVVGENAEVRLAAVECCAEMLSPFVRVFEVVDRKQRADVLALIQGVLRQLVSVAVVDPSVEVRLCVLRCFKKADQSFLSHLAQADMLELIFMSLHDEKLEIQEEAVALLGKLGDLNPAFVLPRMRKVLLETLSQLTNSRVGRLEEYSARLIAQIAHLSPKFMRPYMNPVLTALIPKLRTDLSHVDVTIQVLNAISELAIAGGADLVRSIDTLFGPLLQFLQDSSSLSRREAALRTLGRLCQNTAYVVDPYRDYPELLDVLLKLLKTEMSVSMRRTTMRVLGIIGALDPYTYKVFMGMVPSVTSNSMALSLPSVLISPDVRDDIVQWFHYERCTLSEFYPAFAIANLMQMLKDEALNHLHRDIIQALLTIFCSLGPKCSQYVDKVVPRLIDVTQSASRLDLRQYFLQQLASLISTIGVGMKPYMPKLFSLIGEAWNEDASMKLTVISVMQQVGAAFGASFAPCVAELCPYLLKVFYADRTIDRSLTCAALACVESISMCLAPYVHLVLPPILTILDDTNVKSDVRRAALDTVCQMSSMICLTDHAPRIMQVWLRAISVPVLQQKLLHLLVAVVRQMWKQFMVFRASVDHALARNGLQCDEYFKLMAQLDKGSAAAPPKPAAFGIAASKPIAQAASTRLEKGQRINFEVLKKTWSVSQLVSKEDWDQWLLLLRIQFIRQSPSAALRACAPLADLHQPLAKDLFNAAFMSVWTDLDEIQQKDLETNLKMALDSSRHTDIIQTILNLAEFMDHSEKGPLPVGNMVLSRSAEQTRAYAKALRYTELHIREKFTKSPDAEHCTALITYANKLNVQEVAAGVVALAEKHNMQIRMQGRWYEKLNEWEKALEMYETEKTLSDEIFTYNLSIADQFCSIGTPKLILVVRADEGMGILGNSVDAFEEEMGNAPKVYMHEMRCMEALGQWSELNVFSKKAFAELATTVEPERKQKMSIIAARGSWAVGDWETMDSYVQEINENSQDGSFLRAVLAVRKEQFNDALAYIDKVRDMSDAELTAMASESYERAYGAMALVQQLTELEEAIEYKMWPERRARIGVVWSRRLQGCRQNVEQWQRLLLVRSLVLSMKEMRPLWIKFSSLCRRQGKLTMSERILCSLLGLGQGVKLHEVGSLPMDKPSLVLAVCKQLWIEKHEQLACSTLEALVAQLERDKAMIKMSEEMSHLVAKCCLKLGEWFDVISSTRTSQQPLVAVGVPPSANPVMMGVASLMIGANHPLTSAPPPVIPPPTQNHAMKYYSAATSYDPNWYKAWHRLASAYFNSAMYQPKTEVVQPMPAAVLSPLASAGAFAPLSPINSKTPVDMMLGPQLPISPPIGVANQNTILFAVQAVKCFVKAITLAEGSRLEDTLRFLTLWFKHGDHVDVFENIRESLKILPVEMWLEVIPQLMARLDSKHNVAQLIKQVVIDLSKVHPQSLVYALTVAAKSANIRRCAVAKEVLSIMSDSQPVLVEQARLVSDELIRCAILWHEQWHEALDEASRLYFQDKNVKGMFELLEPLHEMVERGATTLKEQSFKQTYDNELKEAWNACRGYLRSQNLKELNQAWDLYYIVFRKISNQLRQLTSLDLNYVSPKLMKAQNLELAVPGTYDPNGPLITIASVGSRLQVISSKQRPRKVIIKGSDGKDYAFLLKGHEDPRQDERVMQLFGLVNTLLLHEADTCRRNLTIQRYSIVTLSQNSGLIGWVPNCDTLHSLIRDYREKKNILLSMEHKLMQAFATDLDQLTLAQKVQVFEHALEMTSGNDLQQILWLKSPDSEVWFERRTNYTRSMACMSMVGYILGLGDRHPSNLMLDRVSGKIVHIDFGDCFEVAMTREKFPEKIPFRLTRMLIQAMEATGIEGNYRITCERVLRVLRSNKESLLAVLEAFVYDPLINWRLMEAGGKRAPPESQQRDGQRDSRAERSLKRIRHKLCGRDFQPNVQYAVPEQVSRLIDQATSPENLCQCYIGWCPFW